jgi:hypothetical protein
MNRHVNAISGRLSLRQPQRESLGILDRSGLRNPAALQGVRSGRSTCRHPK